MKRELMGLFSIRNILEFVKLQVSLGNLNIVGKNINSHTKNNQI